MILTDSILTLKIRIGILSCIFCYVLDILDIRKIKKTEEILYDKSISDQ